MEPTLRDGDWIVALPPRRLPRIGEIVIARDPADPGRVLIKRVTKCDGGMLSLASDSPEHRAHFQERPVPLSGVLGRPWFRYAPVSRVGWVR